MADVVIKNLKDRIDAIEDVGTLPQVMARILAIVEDDSSTALDLASEISRDQALTMRVLRAVNSAYYGFQRQILTVPEAVVILGFNEVERLSLAIAVINTLGMDRENVKSLRLMWRHSMACSVAGTIFEQRFAAKMPEVRGAHVAGLIHDIGKAVIAQHIPEAVPVIAMRIQEDGLSAAEAEREVLGGYSHCEIGAWMAEKWGLPEPLVESILLHHTTEEVPPEKVLVHATHAIDEICNSLGMLSYNMPYVCRLNEKSAAIFGYGDELQNAVRAQLDKSQRLLGAVGSGAMF
jgi:putative nucleotidyltransferase with HDIG domain